MTLNVYIAGPYAARDRLRAAADDLYFYDLACTSTWLEETHAIEAGTIGAAPALSGEQVAAHAKTDLLDIDRSDVVVLFTAAAVGLGGSAAGGTGGRHVETGYAIAREKPVFVVGDPENVFHRLPSACILVGYWPDALREIVRMTERGTR